MTFTRKQTDPIHLNKIDKYMIHPESIPKTFFDFIGSFLIIYQAIIIPFQLSFGFESKGTNNFDMFIDCFFMTDLLINFNVGYYFEASLVLNRKLAIANYFCGWFPFDLLSSFPYSWIITAALSEDDSNKAVAQSTRLIKLLRSIRFLKLLRLIKLFKTPLFILRVYYHLNRLSN